MSERIQINRHAPPPPPNYWNNPTPPQKPGMVLHSLRTKSDTDTGKAAAASIPVLTKPAAEPERKPSPFVPKSRPAPGRSLSTRQQNILNLIRDCYDRGDFPPSIRDIGEHVGLSSSSTVHSHLKSLETKGYIKRDPSKPRAITILNYSPHVQEAARLRSILEKIAQHWDDPATAKSILQEALGAEKAADVLGKA